MIKSCALLAVMLMAIASPAWPCSWLGPDPVPTPQDLLAQAKVVVRARAERSDTPGSLSATVPVRFTVLEVLKGEVTAPELLFDGYLEAADDPNTMAVPYTFVRTGGRHGNCYAKNYKAGAEYLLFLKPSYVRPDGIELPLTPYWAPLKPANEQVTGADDAWAVWVRTQVLALRQR